MTNHGLRMIAFAIVAAGGAIMAGVASTAFAPNTQAFGYFVLVGGLIAMIVELCLSAGIREKLESEGLVRPAARSREQETSAPDHEPPSQA